jgi:hypothetical protein
MVHDFFLLLSDTSGWFMDMGVWVYTGGGGEGKNEFFFTLPFFYTNYSDLKNMFSRTFKLDCVPREVAGRKRAI